MGDRGEKRFRVLRIKLDPTWPGGGQKPPLEIVTVEARNLDDAFHRHDAMAAWELPPCTRKEA